MKNLTLITLAVSGLLGLASAAFAQNPADPPSDNPSAAKDCVEIALSVSKRIKSNPAAILEIVEMEVTATPACSCEIVKSAIRATDAKPELIVKIVETAAHASPENMRLISQCAIAVAPDSLAAIQKLMKELNAGDEDSATSSKSAKSAKSAKVSTDTIADAVQNNMGGDPLDRPLLHVPIMLPPNPPIVAPLNVTQVNP